MYVIMYLQINAVELFFKKNEEKTHATAPWVIVIKGVME